MQDCIYLKKSCTELCFTGQEHIIPAALGGRTKLPLGAVSDEMNHTFSKREKIALDNTILAVNRENNGPGKRGSDRVKYIIHPNIQVFEYIDTNHENAKIAMLMPRKLGFLFYGSVQLIPQLYCQFRNDYSCELPRISLGSVDCSITIDKYLEKLNTFLLKPNKHIGDYRLVQTELDTKSMHLILGLYNNIWYVNSSFSVEKIEAIFEAMEKHPLYKSFFLINENQELYHYSTRLPNVLDDAISFLYAKTAFNTLAFLKGVGFVQDAQFDEMRLAIIAGKIPDTLIVVSETPKWLKDWVITNVALKSHFVVLYGHNNQIKAYVSFYRELVWSYLLLSRDYNGAEFCEFFICNYLAKKETHGNIKI